MGPSTCQFPSSVKLGVIGGGTMAKAILFPLFDQGLVKPANVIVGGNTSKPLEVWKEHGCTIVAHHNATVLETADVILWAIKPQVFLTAELAPELKLQRDGQKSALHISVMAGITLKQFTDRIEALYLIRLQTEVKPRTIRTMPNIGHRVGAGCTGAQIAELEENILHALFSSTGMCMEIPESQMNGFSALTGSGIGFMMPVLEALADGAVKVGIPRDMALQTAAQTMKGAAELYLKERTHPGQLKDSVCSAGGSTIVGIAEMEKVGVRIGFINAIDAANRRAEELGKI